MLFRRVVLSALLAGALAGLALSAFQRWQVIPIIDAAESFEQARSPQAAADGHSHDQGAATPGAHEHPADAWAPADGAERIGFTIFSNVLTAAGFALVLMAAMSAYLRRSARGGSRVGWRHGLLWGLAGYAVFYVAPTLGLPPEIPGAEAAPLEARQVWWVLTVALTAAGLAGAVFLRSPWRWAALLLIAVPHLIGAPHLGVSPFADYPPEAAAQLAELAKRFVWATAVTNGLFWIVLGVASAWALQRFVRQELA